MKQTPSQTDPPLPVTLVQLVQRGRPHPHPLRTIMNALCSVARTGGHGRHGPSAGPPWDTVSAFVRTWRLRAGRSDQHHGTPARVGGSWGAAGGAVGAPVSCADAMWDGECGH